MLRRDVCSCEISFQHFLQLLLFGTLGKLILLNLMSSSNHNSCMFQGIISLHVPGNYQFACSREVSVLWMSNLQ